MIDFSSATWCIILFIFGLHGFTTWIFDYKNNVFNGFTEYQLLIICTITPFSTFMMSYTSRSDLADMADAAREGRYTVDKPWLVKFCCLSEKTVRETRFQVHGARVTEALMFLAAYSLMRLVGDKHFWQDDHQHSEVIKFCILGYYLVLFCVIGYKAVPEVICTTCVAFSLPPYMDPSDWAMAEACVHHGEEIAFRCSGSEVAGSPLQLDQASVMNVTVGLTPGVK